MSDAFSLLASELGISPRTLRRAAERGTLRASRRGWRIELPATEKRYALRYWPLIRQILAFLRARHDVRLAVLYGSVARGEDHAWSDLDLVVSVTPQDGLRVIRLERELEATVGRRLQLVTLDEARRHPVFLAELLRDGRVLVDRDGIWRELMAAQAELLAIGDRAAREHEVEAWRFLEELARR